MHEKQQVFKQNFRKSIGIMGVKQKKRQRQLDGEISLKGENPKEDSPEVETLAKRAKVQNELTFLDRLHGKDPLSALAEIDKLVQCQGEEDFISKFLEQGGGAKDLLSVLDRESKVKSSDVAVVFGALESLLHNLAKRISSSEDEIDHKKFHQLALDIARFVLDDHVRYVLLLLSPSNTAYQVRAALGLLTSVVACGAQEAKEVLLKLDFTHPSFESLSSRQSSAEIRESFVRFFLSFLLHSESVSIMRLYQDKCKQKIAAIFPKIGQDSVQLILFILITLRDKFIQNSNISKTDKMQLFSVTNLKPILQLCTNWKIPKRESAEGEVDKDDEAEMIRQVGEASRDFFLALLTSHKHGVVFYDVSGGTSGQNQNHLLQNLLRVMENSWENKFLSEIVVKALGANPDQLKPFCSKVLQPLWSPRPTQTWQQVATLLCQIYSAVDLTHLLTDLRSRPTFMRSSSSIVKNIFCSESIFRDVICPAIDKEENLTIRSLGMQLCEIIFSKISAIFALKIFSNKGGEALTKIVLSALSMRAPKLSSVVSFWQFETARFQNGEMELSSDSLMTLQHAAKVLEFYAKHFPKMFEDVESLKFLQASMPLCERIKAEGFRDVAANVQLGLLKIFVISSASHCETLLQADILQSLVAIAMDSTNIHNSIVATQILDSVLGFDKNFSDMMKIWLWSAPNEVSDDICAEIVAALSKKFRFEAEMKIVVDKFPTILINWPLISILRSKPLRKKFKDYFLTCLGGMAYLQEDPFSFCRFVYEEEKVKEFKDLTRLRELTALDNRAELSETIHCMKKLIEFKSGSASAADVTQLLGQSTCKELVASKILERKSVKKSFDPISDTDGFSSVICDLLQMVTCSNLHNVYSELLVQKLLECLKNRSEPIPENWTELRCLPRAFDVIKISDIALEMLLNFFVDNIVADSLSSAPRGVILSSLLSHLLEMHFKQFMNLVFEAKPRSFFHDVVVSILKTEKFPSSHVSLVETIGLVFETDRQFWKQFSIEEASLAYDRIEAPSAGRLLELIILNTDGSVAADFIRHLKDNPSLLLTQLKNHLPAISASLHRRFFANMKMKASKKLCKQMVFEILKMPDEEVTKEMSEFVERIVLDFSIDWSVEAFLPNVGDNPFRHRIMLHLIKQIGDAKLLADEILCKMLEIIPNTLKAISKSTEDDILRERLKNFCKLTAEGLEIEDFEEVLKRRLASSRDKWQNFVRVCLKHGIRLKQFGAIDVLSKFCEKIYTEKDSTEISQIYDMVCGHSSFVDTILSSSSKEVDLRAKEKVLSFILTLIRCKKSLISSAQLPLFLGAYRASLSKCDRILLNIIYHHDFQFEEGIPLQAFKPLLWGDAAISKYSHGHLSKFGKSQHLSKVPKTSEVLALIESNKMIETSIKFPLDLKMDFENSIDVEIENQSLYDPRFFLYLFAQVCSTESYVDRHLKLVESGVLCLGFASLSSKDSMVRAAGATVLSRVFVQLEGARKSLAAEKQVWIHLLNVFRNGFANVSKSSSAFQKSETENLDVDLEVGIGVQEISSELPRIPSLLSAFLVRACVILSNPLDPMYKAISSFLLAKPLLEIYGVPEFLRLFHSKDPIQHDFEREWIVSVIVDGMRDELSYSVLQQNFVFKMIQSFHDSSLATVVGVDRGDVVDDDVKLRRSILEVVRRAVQLKRPAFDLVRNRGLLLWVLSQKTSPVLVDIVVESWKSISQQFRPDSGSLIPPSILCQFYQTTTRLLQGLAPSPDEFLPVDCVKNLVKIFSEVVLIMRVNDETQVLLPKTLTALVKELMSKIINNASPNLQSDKIQFKRQSIYADFKKLL